MCADKYSPALSIRTAAGDRSIEDGSIVLNALQLIRENGLLFCVFSFSDIFAVLRILFYRKYLYNTYN